VSLATFTAAQLLRVIPRVRVSHAVGRLCEKELPEVVARALAEGYARVYGVNMREADSPRGGYKTFDAFFTRALRAGARQVSEHSIVSPADGMLQATGVIDADARLIVKGRPFGVNELTGDAGDATRYAGGSFAIVYLSPRDYHRVHSPVDGRVTRVRAIPGDLYPVNSIGEKHVPRLLVRNHRVAIVIESSEHGRVTVVMVGAIIVGRISVSMLPGGAVPLGAHEFDPPVTVRRGDEIGIFHLGSTAVLLLEAGNAVAHAPGPVLYGQSLLGAP
jgi:phosphatidylserine decarboxylase